MISNPTPQRQLRGPHPARVAPRAANTAEHYARLAARLTPRDRWLARMLFEHKVFTSHQIVQLAFPTVRAANLRLLALYRWRIVDRFQPHVTLGSAPMHYVLDVAGATTLANEEGIDLHQMNYRHDREIGRAYSLQLAHTVGCNTIFTTLIDHSRQPDAQGRLTAWWSAPRCARHFGDIVQPDGYGRWHQHGRDIEWFLEFDFGTETLNRLAGKLHRYERLAATTGITTPVLVWLPSDHREANARRVLADTLRSLDHPERVPVATTSTTTVGSDRATDATAARWQPVDHSAGGRVHLVDLPLQWPELHTPAPPPTAPPPTTAGAAPARHERPAPTPLPPRLSTYRQK
jgi:hypothetical protein